MNAYVLFVLVSIGIVAGMLGGVIGLGGGIIMIPALTIFLSMDQRMAQGTSIAVMLPPIGLLAAYNYYKGGYVNMKYAMIIALAFLIGGYLGSKMALTVPVELVRKSFAVVIVLIAIKMYFTK